MWIKRYFIIFLLLFFCLVPVFSLDTSQLLVDLKQSVKQLQELNQELTVVKMQLKALEQSQNVKVKELQSLKRKIEDSENLIKKQEKLLTDLRADNLEIMTLQAIASRELRKAEISVQQLKNDYNNILKRLKLWQMIAAGEGGAIVVLIILLLIL